MQRERGVATGGSSGYSLGEDDDDGINMKVQWRNIEVGGTTVSIPWCSNFKVLEKGTLLKRGGAGEPPALKKRRIL